MSALTDGKRLVFLLGNRRKVVLSVEEEQQQAPHTPSQ